MAKTQAESNLDDPKEMFAWMFAAGVPDPRSEAQGRAFPNQPCIPIQCYGALSELLYKMGARFHPEFQTLWVEQPSGPAGNYALGKVVDAKPDDPAPTDLQTLAAQMLADQFPDKAQQLVNVTPGSVNEAEAEAANRLLESLEKLRNASAAMQQAGGAVVPAPTAGGA